MPKVTDFTNFKVNSERVDKVKELFSQGEAKAQTAFKELVQYVLDELEAHRDGENPAPRGLSTAIRDELVKAGFGETGSLSKSYLQPALTLANQLHKGSASDIVKFIWDNFEDEGRDFEGAAHRGPLYTPGRLNAAWGKLSNTKDSSPFELTMNGIEANGRGWHTYTIPELRALVQRGQTEPKVMDTILNIFGDPSNPEKKKGKLGRLVENLREDNKKLNSPILAEAADHLENFIEEERADLEVVIAQARVEDVKKQLKRSEQKRLEVTDKSGRKSSYRNLVADISSEMEVEEEETAKAK